MKIVVGDISVECVQSDIENQRDVAALFYYLAQSNETVADHASLSTNELRPGQALLEQLPGFPGRYRVVASGPDDLEDGLAIEVIKCCLANAIALCEREKIISIAIPLTAGMARKIPVPLAAEIAASVIADHTHCRNLRFIRFSLANAQELNTLPRYLIQAAAALAHRKSASSQ